MIRFPYRLATVFALLLSVFAIVAPNTVEAQSGTASLTIHSRFCPPGYDGSDIYNDCHGNPGLLAIQYSANQYTTDGSAMSDPAASRDGVPDNEGNLTFEGLPSGTYRIRSSLPVEMQRPAIYCSPGDGSEPTYYEAVATYDAFSGNHDYFVFSLDLSVGDATTCDWYTLPESDLLSETANLMIHNRFCPVGYDGSDEFAVCHGNVGIAYTTYSISGANSRSEMMIADGNAYFNWLSPGVSHLVLDYDKMELSASISCSNLGTGEQPFLVQHVSSLEGLDIELSAGATVVCDWYIYPPDEYFQLKSRFSTDVLVCPSDPGVFAYGTVPDQCSPATGVQVVVYPAAAGTGYAEYCVIDVSGRCLVNAPRQVPLTVEIDTSTLPADYLPMFNPVTTVSHTEYSNARFILIPAAVDEGD